MSAIDREARRSEPAPPPAGGDAPPAAPKGDAVNVPAWNWRFRRFQPAPAADDDAGERTQQMPAVTRPGNGLPPRVERPPRPEAAARDAVTGRAGEPAIPPAAQPSPAPGAAQASPLPDAPEAVAGRLAERLHADTVALLLDNNRGLLEVAGGVGLIPAERQAQVEYGHEVLRELFRVGVGLIEDTDRVRGHIHGIPGARCQTLVMVPLVHEGHGFGALVIGRSDHPGKPRAEFTEAEIEALMDFAEDVAAPLRSTVLLRRLKGQLGSADKG